MAEMTRMERVARLAKPERKTEVVARDWSGSKAPARNRTRNPCSTHAERGWRMKASAQFAQPNVFAVECPECGQTAQNVHFQGLHVPPRMEYSFKCGCSCVIEYLTDDTLDMVSFVHGSTKGTQ